MQKASIAGIYKNAIYISWYLVKWYLQTYTNTVRNAPYSSARKQV